MNARKPNLFHVLWTSVILVLRRPPKVCAEKCPMLVNSHGMTPDRNIRVVRSVRQAQWVCEPANGADGIPNTHKVRLAFARISLLEFLCQSKILIDASIGRSLLPAAFLKGMNCPHHAD